MYWPFEISIDAIGCVQTNRFCLAYNQRRDEKCAWFESIDPFFFLFVVSFRIGLFVVRHNMVLHMGRPLNNVMNFHNVESTNGWLVLTEMWISRAINADFIKPAYNLPIIQLVLIWWLSTTFQAVYSTEILFLQTICRSYWPLFRSIALAFGTSMLW